MKLLSIDKKVLCQEINVVVVPSHTSSLQVLELAMALCLCGMYEKKNSTIFHHGDDAFATCRFRITNSKRLAVDYAQCNTHILFSFARMLCMYATNSRPSIVDNYFHGRVVTRYANHMCVKWFVSRDTKRRILPAVMHLWAQCFLHLTLSTYAISKMGQKSFKETYIQRKSRRFEVICFFFFHKNRIYVA